tara:strand:+ start:49 stop:192 length:144 start_codon:yes stop_codon:yes gene_type:complete
MRKIKGFETSACIRCGNVIRNEKEEFEPCKICDCKEHRTIIFDEVKQ